MKKNVKILSVRLGTSSKEEIMSDIRKRIAQGKKTKIFTPNPQILLKAKKDGSLMEILRKGDILTPDGIGLLYASKILGEPIKERISGIDLAEDILAFAEKKGYSVFLLGGKKGCARRAARNLKAKYPSLRICGCHNGYFAKYGEENLLVRTKIALHRPDILFVCLGFPTQEKWITENLHYLPTVKIAMGLGGSIDVWAGKLPRAPKTIRKMGLEWVWRTALEPRRIGILKDIPLFLFCIMKQKMATRSYESHM